MDGQTADRLTSLWLQEAVEKADRTILTPVLRTFGNLAAGGGAAVSEQLLSCADGECHMIAALKFVIAAPEYEIAALKCEFSALEYPACLLRSCYRT